MLRAFGHRVAMCCDMLGIVGSNLTSFKLEPTTRNMSQQGGQTRATCCAQQCWDMLRWMLRSFGRGFIPKLEIRQFSSIAKTCYFFSFFTERKTCIPEEQRLRNYWIELEANLSEFISCFKLERQWTNQTRGKLHDSSEKREKHVRESPDLFWCYFWLVGQNGVILVANRLASQCKTKTNGITRVKTVL